MNTQSSFSLNPNMSDSASANEGFFWDNQLWPFGNFDTSANAATGNGVGGGDVKAVVSVADEKAKMVNEEASQEEKKENKRKADVDLESHIYTERERRKKMRNMFSNLHAMLPQLPPKTDKTTIVDEAVKHIKTLEIQLQKLQEQKANKLRCATKATVTYEPISKTSPHLKLAGPTTRESFLADHAGASLKIMAPVTNSHEPLMFHTWTSPNVVLNTFGQEAQIMICSPWKRGLLNAIVVALDKNMIEVESANVSGDGRGCFFMIHVRLASGAIEQSPESFSAEGVFKQGVRELMQLFPSK